MIPATYMNRTTYTSVWFNLAAVSIAMAYLVPAQTSSIWSTYKLINAYDEYQGTLQYWPSVVATPVLMFLGILLVSLSKHVFKLRNTDLEEKLPLLTNELCLPISLGILAVP